MMNPLKAVCLPEYLFNPRQIFMRLRRSFAKPPCEVESVILPWGARISVRPREVIGARLWYYGIFDMEVAELIFRLLDAGETALDIGANIGVMTTLMCARVGDGSVLAFEPHPKVFSDLRKNVSLFTRSQTTPQLHQLALSNRNGTAFLEEGLDWENNRGTARVASPSPDGSGRLSITVATLDSMFDSKCHVCKIDVEGHEFDVFQGAGGLLSRAQIRDIIFEDRGLYPTKVQTLLKDYGYEIFSVHKRLWGPTLQPLRAQPEFRLGIEGENFLATLEPKRALARCAARRWRVLSRARNTAPSA
jgi:FkbM family methyltransferase